VAPPSGRFIVQLFLVPGLIVAVAVLILLGFKFLVGGTRTPDEFLRDLDSPNPDVRWRAASDLAQVLNRPESLALASDPRFGLELASRLRETLADINTEEKLARQRATQDSNKRTPTAAQILVPKRRYALFLINCLGNLTVPVGGPLLCDIAKNQEGTDVKWIGLRRRRAVWALANLGNNLHRFQELSTPEKEAVLVNLDSETSGSSEMRSRAAQAALDYLKHKKPLHVDETLVECAEDQDPFLRVMVAFALKYWDGPGVEKTLWKLSGDDGHGEAIEVEDEA
jgi:HEAT repeat protein